MIDLTYLLNTGYPNLVTYRTSLSSYYPPTASTPDTVHLDGVGGCTALVRASIHREGAVFPAYPFQNQMETEGFGQMVKSLGGRMIGLPKYYVYHGQLFSRSISHMNADANDCFVRLRYLWLKLHILLTALLRVIPLYSCLISCHLGTFIVCRYPSLHFSTQRLKKKSSAVTLLSFFSFFFPRTDPSGFLSVPTFLPLFLSSAYNNLVTIVHSLAHTYFATEYQDKTVRDSHQHHLHKCLT